MERYFTRTSTQTTDPVQTQAQDQGESSHVLNLDDIVSDPAFRKQIHEYAPEIRDQVRMAYIQKRPHQPIVIFPHRQFGAVTRAFSQSWYGKFNWIEYSERFTVTNLHHYRLIRLRFSMLWLINFV
jgi:hypothetical protein